MMRWEALVDPGRDLLWRQYIVYGPKLDSHAGHTKDHTRILILGQGVTALSVDPLNALGAVASHTGHDDCDTAILIVTGHRIKEYAR